MTLNEISLEAYTISSDHGFWEGPEQDNIPTKLALIHEEVSEALKAFRLGEMELRYEYKSTPQTRPARLMALVGEEPYFILQGGEKVHADYEGMKAQGYEAKPEGFGVELADAIIRIADLARRLEIDLDGLVRLKMDYNKTRPHMHGGRKV